MFSFLGWARAFLIAGLLGLLLLSLPGMALAAPPTLPIHQARQQLEGSEVCIMGIVTVPSGRFRSATLDQGFAIQDSTSGIYVSTNQNIELRVGDTVDVEGTLQDDGHGQQIVRLKHWKRHSRLRKAIAPQPASVQAAITQLDGKLVTVQGSIVRPLVDDAPYGDRLWIEDDTGIVQIYIPRSTGIAPQELSFLQPGNAIRVIGFSSQYDQNEEVIPRGVEDVSRVKLKVRS